MKVPFTKAHGAKNDFLLTWQAEAPSADLPRIARAMFVSPVLVLTQA